MKAANTQAMVQVQGTDANDTKERMFKTALHQEE